ncbi:hypothetical protein EVA_08698 [gut metagenome]|uniref:Uncharacterized protein n=1 Tax=gut metagenome TaxID=749906 RepID=J9G7I2_9ZZZZ
METLHPQPIRRHPLSQRRHPVLTVPCRQLLHIAHKRMEHRYRRILRFHEPLHVMVVSSNPLMDQLLTQCILHALQHRLIRSRNPSISLRRTFRAGRDTIISESIAIQQKSLHLLHRPHVPRQCPLLLQLFFQNTLLLYLRLQFRGRLLRCNSHTQYIPLLLLYLSLHFYLSLRDSTNALFHSCIL